MRSQGTPPSSPHADTNQCLPGNRGLAVDTPRSVQRLWGGGLRSRTLTGLIKHQMFFSKKSKMFDLGN